MLNEDGTLPNVEQRVKAGYDYGWVTGMVTARDLDRDEIEQEQMGHAFTKAERLIEEHRRRVANMEIGK